jgi:hypothetical protein
VKIAVETELGVIDFDLDDEEIVAVDEGATLERDDIELELPLVVAAARSGSTIVAVVDRRPPLVVSYDAGTTWHEAGAGLPAGRAVAVSPEHPDLVLFASETRVHLSRDGGRFWQALPLELAGVRAVAWIEGPPEQV